MSIFWKIYSMAYDILLELAPYQEMIRDVGAGIPAVDKLQVLDAGCGTGNLLQFLEKKIPGATLVGIDLSPEMLQLARTKISGQTSLIQADLNKALPFHDAAFGLITSTNVLYFVKEPRYTLQEYQRLLNPGGLLILTTLKPGFAPLKIISEHMKKVGFFRTLRFVMPLIWVGLCNIYSLNNKNFHYFNKPELESLIKAAGFLTVSIKETYAGQDWLVVADKSPK